MGRTSNSTKNHDTPERFQAFIPPLEDRDQIEVAAYVIRHEGCARKDIINASPWGISKTGSVIKELCDRGLLEVRQDLDGQVGGHGHKYGINKQLGRFVGIEVSTMYDRFVLSDFSGTVLQEKEYSSSIRSEDPIESLIDHIRDFVAESSDSIPILGFGIGLHGLFDERSGVLQRVLSINKTVNLPIKSVIETKFGVPVTIGHPKMLTILAENKFDAADKSRCFLNVNLGYGVGLGVFLDREFFPGATGMAGEFGHMIIRDNPRKCYCGNQGCLRTLVSYEGIVQQTIDRIEAGFSAEVDSEVLHNSPPAVGVAHILDLAIQKDQVCMSVINETGVQLGRALGTVTTLLNPDLIVIHSNLARAGELFTAPVKLNIDLNTLPQSNGCLRLEFVSVEPFAVAAGAAVLALRQLLEDLRPQKSVDRSKLAEIRI